MSNRLSEKTHQTHCEKISLLGNKGGNAKKLSNLNIIVPSPNTARIQESHIFLGHFIFEQVENLILKNEK